MLLLDRSQGQCHSIADVVDAAMVSQGTVSNTKNRYFDGGLERALYERPRPGARPKIDGEVEARLTTIACSQAPEGRKRWTLRLLAKRLVELELVDSISHEAVRQAIKKTTSNPG